MKIEVGDIIELNTYNGSKVLVTKIDGDYVEGYTINMGVPRGIFEHVLYKAEYVLQGVFSINSPIYSIWKFDKETGEYKKCREEPKE